MPDNRPQQYSAILTKKEQLTKSVILFTFRLQQPSSMQFIAGQYGTISVDTCIRRQYSFCNPPNDPATFEMVIDTAPMGPGSKFFLAKHVGDTISCMAPLGMFVLDKTTYRKKVMVATGTGIAPFRSMILDYLNKGGTDDIILYWGMRHEVDLYWVNEFQELTVKYPNFRFILCLSRPDEASRGSAGWRRGRVTEHVVQEEPNLPGSDFYLCGNRLMIKDIETQLLEHLVSAAQIHKEMYF
jgi:ferredoxin-NADP reductase